MLRLEADDRHLNPGGTVHGGALATLVDSAMGMALRTTTNEDEVPVTIDLNVSYLSPGRTGTLTATAQLRKRGKRITIVEAEVVQEGDDGDDVVVLATGTFTTVS